VQANRTPALVLRRRERKSGNHWTESRRAGILGSPAGAEKPDVPRPTGTKTHRDSAEREAFAAL
ncbi:MAG: hypothetical protein JSU86_04735, partial [Phycisphaerales bacterium]